MTFFLALMAIFGWLAAFIMFGILVILSVALGATHDLEPVAKEHSIDKNNKGTRTIVWSSNKEKEIPFGD